MKKVIVTLVLLVGLGIVGWRIYVKVDGGKSEGGMSRGRGKVAVAVEVASIRKTVVREIGRFSGSLSPRSLFVVAPKISGRLEKLTVDVGDLVKPGQLIAELDDQEFVQQCAQARAELAVAQATVAERKSEVIVAGRELGRANTLREKKVVSEFELDEAQARHAAAQAKHEVALAEVRRRQAGLRAAEVRLSYTRIKASWGDAGDSRVVGERFVDQGEMLRANTAIVSILDNSVMTAQVDVIERDYPKVNIGQKATIITDAYPEREFYGNIVRIAPLLKETSRQARIEIEIPNPKRLLKPGMFVRAQIEFDRHENATVVPVAALARRDGKLGVFQVDAATMKGRFIPVTTGISEGDMVEILKPSLAGRVVTLGHHLLEDGGAIRLPAPAQKPATPAGTKSGNAAPRGGKK